jgi:thimet oligopeptidase
VPTLRRLVTLSTTQSSPPTATVGDLPFRLGAAELREAAERVIHEAERDLAELIRSSPPPTIPAVLEPLNRLLTRVHDVSDHGSLIFAVHPDAETRSAGREISEAADRFFNSYRLNEGVYRALKAVDLPADDTATRFAVSKMLREMRRAGVEKELATRQHLLELSNRIDQVSNQFSENIANMDREIEVDGADELRGLPPDYLGAHPAGTHGKIRITTKYPDFFPVMAYCDDADVRRRLLEQFMNRAYPENLPVLDQLLAVRGEFARTLGYSSYAAFALEDKMMGSPAAARTFLERVGHLLALPAEDDLRRYLGRKRRDHPDATSLELWDSEFFGRGYYDGKIRTEEFGVDAKVLRSYLPYGRVREGLVQLCQELFGLSFQRAHSAEVWHPTVEAYDVMQGPTLIGRCYLDLVPREGKFSHAACFTVRSGVTDIQLPQAALVCNFLDPKSPPEEARMEWGEVVTFFHEFGHLIHALLGGRSRWLFNGPGYVEWDFVEAPSQLFEEWARDPTTLSHFARNPDTGEGIPPELLRRLQAAEALGRPSRLLRQVALAAISLELYDRDPTGMDTAATIRAAYDQHYPRPLPADSHFQAAFGHLTGYSAFYYTYLWSVVIARDLLSPFFAQGTLTDPKIAQRYAQEILAAGSCRPAAELVESYLGRPFNFEAFEGWARQPAALERSADRPPAP